MTTDEFVAFASELDCLVSIYLVRDAHLAVLAPPAGDNTVPVAHATPQTQSKTFDANPYI